MPSANQNCSWLAKKQALLKPHWKAEGGGMHLRDSATGVAAGAHEAADQPQGALADERHHREQRSTCALQVEEQRLSGVGSSVLQTPRSSCGDIAQSSTDSAWNQRREKAQTARVHSGMNLARRSWCPAH